MKLYCNQLMAHMKYKKINEDYFFYQITTSENYIKGGSSFLDIEDVSYICSIVFESGKNFYIMTKKNTSRKTILNLLSQYEKGDTLSLKQLKAEELPDYIVVQLFFNSLSNPNDERYSYNNIAGKLLIYRPSWIKRGKENIIWGLDCLEIKVNRDMCLSMIAHKMTALVLKNKMNFEKRKLKEYPQYYFSYYNHTLKRVPKEKLNEKTNLIQKPVQNERGSISFLQFKDYEAFSCTKIGVLYECFQLMKAQYNAYLELSLKEYEIQKNIEVCNSVKQKEALKVIIQEQLEKKGIAFVDMVKSNTSEAYLQDVANQITSIFPNVKCKIAKRLSKNKVNIRYIHNKDFYNAVDPHQDNLKDYVVQHITVENFNYKSKAVVSNILKELVIKKDLKEKNLSMIDWKKYTYQKDWIFGMVVNDEYYFMKIHPDGTFDIQMMERNLFNMAEYDEYIKYFKEDFHNEQVIGMIKDAEGNINLIKNTNLYTIPDFIKVGDILKDTSEDCTLSGEDIILLFQEIINISSNLKVKQELENLINNIQSNHIYHKKEIMGLLNEKPTKIEVVKYVYENTGIRLYAYLRNKEARQEYLSGVIDINYFNITDDGAYYCVGEVGVGIKDTIGRASVIRKIEAVEHSKLIFQELLPLMGIEFVRYGMLTVVPFPFKYLREYIQIVKNK